MNKKSPKKLRRILVSFFVKLVVVYALFLGLWVGISDWYPRQLQRFGFETFHSIIVSTGSSWAVGLAPPISKVGRFDSTLIVQNRKTGARGQQPFSSLSLAYLPMAMTLSLILASPVSWKRRLVAVVFGSLFVGIWTSLAIFFMVLNAYCGEPPLGMYALEPWLTKSIGFVTWVVSVSTVPQFVVPVFFWLLVTIRSDDIRQLAGLKDHT